MFEKVFREVIPTGINAGMTYEESFLTKHKVVDSGCWEWSSKVFSNGYGCFYINGTYALAHRVSYMAHNNLWELPVGAVVMHSCDNRKCVNPSHLRLGTVSDNSKDMIAKGRHNWAVGERSRKAIFKDGDIRTIRRLAEMGMTRQQVAKLFNTNYQTIGKIMDNQRWKHVEGKGIDADTYSKLAARTANDMGSETLNLVHAVMGIGGESGEVVDIVKKHFAYGKELDTTKLKEELSDLLWYVSLALGVIGSSFGEVFDMNIKKLSTRYPDLKFDADRAINRDDDAEQAAILG